MKTNPLISVIIPAYNIEKYIGECLDSVINQTYKNLEILVVNDGSKDNTGAIIDEYTIKDERVKHLKKENGGLSDARNYGLDRITGDYISFVDGDDLIDTDMYESLINSLSKYDDVDLLKFGLKTFNDNSLRGGDLDAKLRKYTEEKVDKNTAIERFVSGELIAGSVWIGLYRSKVFDDVRFAKGKYYEDGPVSLETLFYVRSVLLCHTEFYNYRRGREDSISFKYTEKLFDENDILETMLVKYNNKPYYTQAINNYSIEQLMHLYSDVSASPQEDKNTLLRRTTEIVKTRRGTELMTKDTMKRFRYKLFLFNPKLFGFFNFIMRKLKRR